MINIYVGPAIGNVVSLHASEGRTAQALRRHHVPRWRQGGLTAGVVQISDWATLGIVLSEIHRSEGELVLVTSRAEYENRPPGAFGILLSIEGYTSFAGDFDALHIFAELGCTAFTFSHNVQNPLCTGANERFGDGGFSHLGKATLKELESLPLMVDLVHTSRGSFWDALDLYQGDLFVSHSNADAIRPHPRNLTDDQIKAVAERNGVIGLNSCREYVGRDPLQAKLSDLLDHAMHMYDLVGPEHIAIGADYWEGPMDMLASVMKSVDPDGSHGLRDTGAQIYGRGPEGIEDAGQLNKLPAGLAERGLTLDEIDLICGGNYLRMLERTRPSA
ncbi:dipeptidase [Streptomyces malaysiensis]|uniref:dipeptidase n=1 Tax=Streptomyces malaysiensis TaxID=92644 RepID=UPI00370FAD3F